MDSVMIAGYWKDVFDYDDRTVETSWQKNVVTFDGHKILSGLLLDDPDMNPIEFMSQGRGDSDWDNSLVEPDPGQSSLVDEIDRRSPDSINYVDQSGTNSLDPQRQVRIETTYPKSDPLNGETIREQGLFGGINVSTDFGSGFLFNVYNHQKIEKDSSFSLTRKAVIEFS